MIYFVLIERFKMPLSILRPSDGLGITLEISCTVYWLSTPVKKWFTEIKNRYQTVKQFNVRRKFRFRFLMKLFKLCWNYSSHGEKLIQSQ